jgi:hypothetical protein
MAGSLLFTTATRVRFAAQCDGYVSAALLRGLCMMEKKKKKSESERETM